MSFKVGDIVEISSNNGLRYKIACVLKTEVGLKKLGNELSTNTLWCQKDNIKLASHEESNKEPKFKIGDRVSFENNSHGDRHVFTINSMYFRGDGSEGYWYLPKEKGMMYDEYYESDIELAPYEESNKEPKKYDTNKPMMSLIRPEFQLELAKALTYGFDKYDEKIGDTPNYLKGEGFHYSKIINSLERHLNAFKRGVKIDDESGIEHLVLAAVNIMFLHTYENSDKGIDDRELLNEKK